MRQGKGFEEAAESRADREEEDVESEDDAENVGQGAAVAEVGAGREGDEVVGARGESGYERERDESREECVVHGAFFFVFLTGMGVTATRARTASSARVRSSMSSM